MMKLILTIVAICLLCLVTPTSSPVAPSLTTYEIVEMKTVAPAVAPTVIDQEYMEIKMIVSTLAMVSLLVQLLRQGYNNKMKNNNQGQQEGSTSCTDMVVYQAPCADMVVYQATNTDLVLCECCTDMVVYKATSTDLVLYGGCTDMVIYQATSTNLVVYEGCTDLVVYQATSTALYEDCTDLREDRNSDENLSSATSAADSEAPLFGAVPFAPTVGSSAPAFGSTDSEAPLFGAVPFAPTVGSTASSTPLFGSAASTSAPSFSFGSTASNSTPSFGPATCSSSPSVPSFGSTAATSFSFGSDATASTVASAEAPKPRRPRPFRRSRARARAPPRPQALNGKQEYSAAAWKKIRAATKEFMAMEFLTAPAVKKWFRNNMALKWHPDKNKSDPDAEEVFKGIETMLELKIWGMYKAHILLEDRLKVIWNNRKS